MREVWRSNFADRLMLANRAGRVQTLQQLVFKCMQDGNMRDAVIAIGQIERECGHLEGHGAPKYEVEYVDAVQSPIPNIPTPEAPPTT